MTKRNAKIIAATKFAPARVLTNQYFNDLLKEDVDTWLRENLTIRERRWCDENESTSTLAVNAARSALSAAGLKAEDLDLIIISTDTPEYISPSTSSVVQNELGAINAGTFDVNTACAGFVTILDMAAKYIAADEKYKNVLVIGAYAMSKYLNLYDKKTVTLFADGAGAAILQASEENRGLIDSQLHTEGQYNEWMGIYAGGTKYPIDSDVLKNGDHQLKFVKKFPREINPDTWTAMIRKMLDQNKLKPNDIKKYFFTQININSIAETLENLGLDMSYTHTVMDRYGYTGSACIPMAFSEALEEGKFKRDDLLVFMGSGGGLAFASALFKY